MTLDDDDLHQVVFNGIDLTLWTEENPHEDGYWFEVQGADFTLGTPQPIMQTIETLLRDGSMVEKVGDDNREPGFTVIVCADPDNGDALAKGEAVLKLATGQMCELLWRGPHGVVAPTVFEVITSWLEDAFDDIELMDGEAAYGLRIIAAPYGRDETETVTAALTVGGGSDVVISNGTSAAGWTSPDGTVTVSSGQLLIPAQATPDSTYDTLDSGSYGVYTPEATVTITPASFAGTPYFWFDYVPAVAGRALKVLQAYADGVEIIKVADYRTGSTKRAIFYTADTSVTDLRVVFTQDVPIGSNCGVLVDNVTRSPRSPKAPTTGRETLRILDIGGSARTQASLIVEHETAGLGDVIVYTAPGLGNGYSPDLRQFYTSGGSGTTADTTLVSGNRTTLSTAAVFDIPAAGLPRGGYILYGRLRAATADHSRAVDFTAVTRAGGIDQPGGQAGTSDPIALTTGAWTIAPLGGLVLPPVGVSENSTATVRVTVARNGAAGGSGEIQFDQLWLFYCGEGSAITFIPAGEGTPAVGSIHNRVWVESPTLTLPVPAVWKGTQSDKSDRIHAGIGAYFEPHEFEPGEMGLHVVTTGAADALVSSRHYRRWQSRAQLEAS